MDITLPGRPVEIGRYHPSTRVVREACDIFVSMGFQVVEGPEVEWDLYNFERLNIPKDHPARDQWNTLWVDTMQGADGQYPMLMRAHTSPMQARIMESTSPPVRVVVPGKVWRYEATDATHESQFFQIEGLAVDEGISFANLRHTLYEFARRMFGEERKVRFRCDYFPFVEPGVDMSIDCFVCPGDDPECGYAAAEVGSRSWAPAWSTPTCCVPPGMTPRCTPASPLAWGWSASPCSSTVSTTSVCSTATTYVFCASSPSRRHFALSILSTALMPDA